MERITYIEQENIIFNAYLGVEDVARLAGVGINRARALINEMLEEQKAEGKTTDNLRRAKKVGTERVLKKLDLNASVHREAEIMRRRKKENENI